MAKVSSEVATGRRIKGAEKLEEKFTAQSPVAGSSIDFRCRESGAPANQKPGKSPVDVQRQQLAEDEAADDGDPRGRRNSDRRRAQRERQTAEQRRMVVHHDGAERSKQAS